MQVTTIHVDPDIYHEPLDVLSNSIVHCISQSRFDGQKYKYSHLFEDNLMACIHYIVCNN